MNMISYKTIGYIVLALVIIGIAIPKLTVRDTVQLTDAEKSCVQTSIKQQLDHPLQRLALALGKSAVVGKQGDGIIKPNTMIVKSYTIFRIPLPVTRLFNRSTQHVICDWASEKMPTDNTVVPGLGTYRETSVMDGKKAYQSARFSVSFYYPEKYLLFESRGEGFGGVEYYVISLVPDSKYIREAMTGVQREEIGMLPSIHFSFYRQPDRTLSLEEWVRAKILSSNFYSSNPEPIFTSATVAGVPAVSYYDVSGLYTRDTVVFLYDEWVVKAAADDMGENTEQDFQTVLSSLQMSATVVSGIPARKTYANVARTFTFQYPSAYHIIDDQETTPNIGRWVQVALQDNDGSFMSVYGETTVQRCHRNLCDRPAEEQLTYNGIVWDYLGDTRYCDAGECDTPSATYRTSKDDMMYYLSFSSPADAVHVLETFRFSE